MVRSWVRFFTIIIMKAILFQCSCIKERTKSHAIPIVLTRKSQSFFLFINHTLILLIKYNLLGGKWVCYDVKTTLIILSLSLLPSLPPIRKSNKVGFIQGNDDSHFRFFLFIYYHHSYFIYIYIYHSWWFFNVRISKFNDQ